MSHVCDSQSREVLQNQEDEEKLTAAYLPSGIHCQWHMYEWWKSNALLQQQKEWIQWTVGSPWSFPFKETNAIKVTSYEMEKSGYGPSVKMSE